MWLDEVWRSSNKTKFTFGLYCPKDLHFSLYILGLGGECSVPGPITLSPPSLLIPVDPSTVNQAPSVPNPWPPYLSVQGLKFSCLSPPLGISPAWTGHRLLLPALTDFSGRTLWPNPFLPRPTSSLGFSLLRLDLFSGKLSPAPGQMLNCGLGIFRMFPFS